MAVLNPGFEDGGARPGEAAHWTLATSVVGERIAGFGPDPYRAWEDFERWFELMLSFEDGDLALALFDPLAEGHEDFEDAWDNDLYLTELPSGQVAVCPSRNVLESKKSGGPHFGSHPFELASCGQVSWLLNADEHRQPGIPKT